MSRAWSEDAGPRTPAASAETCVLDVQACVFPNREKEVLSVLLGGALF